MKRIQAVIAFFLVIPFAVGADVSGTKTVDFFGDAKTISISDGYAFNAPDSFDESKQVTLIILSQQPFAKEELVSARDRKDTITDQLRAQNSPYIELRISHEYNTLESANYVFPDSGNLSTSGNTLGKLTRFDSERVAGMLSDSDVRFDLPIAPPPQLPDAIALPSDGGEPGDAYRALNNAMATGDVDALIRYSNPDVAEMMRDQRDTPEFAEEIAFLKEMNSGEVRVTGGEQLGSDLAILKIEGTTAGEPFTGEVTMRMGSQGWFVEKDSRKY